MGRETSGRPGLRLADRGGDVLAGRPRPRGNKVAADVSLRAGQQTTHDMTVIELAFTNKRLPAPTAHSPLPCNSIFQMTSAEFFGSTGKEPFRLAWIAIAN